MTPKEYIYVRESAVQSIISDAFSFSMFIVLMTLNHFYWGGKWYISVFIMTMWLIFIAGRASSRFKRFNTSQEVIDYLTKEQTK